MPHERPRVSVYTHSGIIHDNVIEAFTEPEIIDPLELKPNTRTVALATMVGAVILTMTLGESVTLNGVLL